MTDFKIDDVSVTNGAAWLVPLSEMYGIGEDFGSPVIEQNNVEILRPVVALAAWTMVMWIWLYATRIPAMP